MSQMDKLMTRVMVFVDRNGVILSKNSSQVNTSLSMKYEDEDFKIKMSAYCHCMGNGSCQAKVEYKGEVVFDACGYYISGPSSVEAKVYEPGEWEEKFPKVE
jgi:hypothetical protein